MQGAKSATVGASRGELDEASEANRAGTRPTDEACANHACDSPRAVDAVEAALAEALCRASAAGEWAVVAQLARELEARRGARSAANVVRIDSVKRDRDKW